MVSGMMYEPYEQGVIMRLEHHLVGGYVRYISPHIIIIIKITRNRVLWGTEGGSKNYDAKRSKSGTI